jgi:hypothetical protein
MTRFFLLSFVLAVVAPAFAQEPMTAEAIVATCQAKTSSNLELNFCVSQMAAERNMDLLEVQGELLRQQEAQLAAQAAELSSLEARVAAMETARVEQPAVQQPTAANTSPAVVTTANLGNAGYYVATRTRVVSNHSLRDLGFNDTVHFTGLTNPRTLEKCGGEGARYAVITNHGVPLTPGVMPGEAMPRGFVEVYYDQTGPNGVPDGQPDAIMVGGQQVARTLWVIDLSVADHMWVTQYRDDRLRIYYMIDVDPVVTGGLIVPMVRKPVRGDHRGNITSCGPDESMPRVSNDETRRAWELRQYRN